jgi:hypothetical protein
MWCPYRALSFLNTSPIADGFFLHVFLDRKNFPDRP